MNEGPAPFLAPAPQSILGWPEPVRAVGYGAAGAGARQSSAAGLQQW
jgi:hypothetical protein